MNSSKNEVAWVVLVLLLAVLGTVGFLPFSPAVVFGLIALLAAMRLR